MVMLVLPPVVAAPEGETTREEIAARTAHTHWPDSPPNSEWNEIRRREEKWTKQEEEEEEV